MKKRRSKGFRNFSRRHRSNLQERRPGGSQSFFFNKGIFKLFPKSKSTPIMLLSRFPHFSSLLKAYLREQCILSTWFPQIVYIRKVKIHWNFTCVNHPCESLNHCLRLKLYFFLMHHTFFKTKIFLILIFWRILHFLIILLQKATY